MAQWSHPTILRSEKALVRTQLTSILGRPQRSSHLFFFLSPCFSSPSSNPLAAYGSGWMKRTAVTQC
jgi:hypothetical protein